MALVNRLNKRGIVPADLVRLLESKIAPRNFGDRATIDLGETGSAIAASPIPPAPA